MIPGRLALIVALGVLSTPLAAALSFLVDQ